MSQGIHSCLGDPVLQLAGQPSLTLTGCASIRILPHETASSGRAPESDPSNSWAVLI